MNIRDVLTDQEIIDGLDALINGNYNEWRKTFPPSKRFADYQLLLAVKDMLSEPEGSVKE